MERHGHLDLDPRVRQRLLAAASPASTTPTDQIAEQNLNQSQGETRIGLG